MRIAITGSNGQLGSALQGRLQDESLLPIDLPEHDITDLDATIRALKEFRPSAVIHAAAMTDVDGCERAPELAYRVNVLGTRNIAVAAEACGASVIYVSTDYVFDGGKDEPYWEYDDVAPLSVYGRTKWLGEQTVRQLVRRHYVVRVAWLYSHGPRNFVRTVLRLGRERKSLTMVTDEIGSPTYAADVADALHKLLRTPAYGTYHLPNSGTCSRYDWARAICDLTGLDVELIRGSNYERVARVPKQVAMRTFCGAEIGITMRPWRVALEDCLKSWV